MAKLGINTRDELVFIKLEDVAYLQAEGNYTHIVYISGKKQTLCLGLSKIEALLAPFYKKDSSPFVRLGRSLIINQGLISHISLTKQQLALSDYDKYVLRLSVSKNILKAYKGYWMKKLKS